MENLIQPTLLLKPFAENGQRNSIPENATGTNQASLDEGFPPLTAQNPRDGGIPPVRLDFNGLGHLTTTYDYFYQAGGTFTFNQTICDAIGGYPLGARLWYTPSDGVSIILRSTKPNNTDNFLQDQSFIGTSWVKDTPTMSDIPVSILEFKWSDHILNDTSWVRADTFSWQDGELYTTAYEHLVDDFDGTTSATETIGSYTITYYLAEDGHKIVLPDMEATVQNIYNESGVAWYYILDTANQRFKLPRTKWGLVGLRDAVGNYVQESLPDHLHNLTVNGTYDNYGPWYGTAGKADYAQTYTATTQLASATSPVYGGTEVQQRATQMYLYFYIGNFSQSAVEQTAGVTTEVLNGKLDSTTPHIIETYQNGTSWYRVWSDGWCEQGGKIITAGSNTTVQLLKEMDNTEYNCLISIDSPTNPQPTYGIWYTYDQQRTYFKYYLSGGSSTYPMFWEVKGYIA